MLVLTLVGLADAAPAAGAGTLQAHVGVSFGVYALPLVKGAAQGLAARVEVGAGGARLQGFAVLEVASVRAPSWEAFEGPAPFVDDVIVTHLGAGARVPLAFGPALRFVPHAALGIASMDTPTDAALREELAWSGQTFTAGPHAVAPFARAGADVGFELAGDGVLVLLGADAGWILAEGVGPTAGARVGAAARF